MIRAFEAHVESRTGAVAVPRFPSPLIKPDVRISRIRLSDWFHRVHTGSGEHRASFVPRFPSASRYSLLESLPDSYGASQACANSPTFVSFDKHTRSQGPSLRRRYPASAVLWPCPTPARVHRHYTVLEPRPPTLMGLPRLPASPFQRAVSNTPADKAGALVDFFPAHAAFPEQETGRHLHRFFRGLLELHSRYGPLDRSTAHGGLCHEASTQPVAQPSRSSASGSIDNCPDGTFLHR
jgi:hypothetical protein